MTDEIFGLSISRSGKLNPWYHYGAMCAAIPGWTLGTFVGAMAGNIMPGFLSSALSVAIYGMFLALIIPPAKKHRPVRAVVAGAMAISAVFAVVPVLNRISSGFVIIFTTLIVAGAAAYFCPIGTERRKLMNHSVYVYILVMAGVYILIRMLPLVLLKRRLQVRL